MVAATTRAPRQQKQFTEREQYDHRWTQLENEYATWKPHYQELSTFLLPRNGRFFTSDRNKGQRRHNSIHDNTGTHAVRVTGSGLMSGATSPARPWVRIVTSSPELNREFSVQQWLDEVTRMVLRVFAKSNTYRVLHMMYEELAVFGTAACLVTADLENVIHCTPLTVGEYRLATDYKGAVNTCYRRFDKSVAEVVKEFGYDNCSPTVQDLYDEGHLQNCVTIMHVIEPRADRDPDKVDALNMPWKSVYYECGREDQKWLRESGYTYFPVLAPRWAVTAGDTYGHSPGMEALGDVKQLQHEQLRKAQGIDFQTLPPMLMPAESKGQEHKWIPGGTSYVNSTTPTQGIRPAFEVRLDLSHLLADIQDVRERINSAFFADLFLMLSLQPGTQRMTATEVAERHEEKLIQLGPVLERLHTELLAPLVRLTYQELADAGHLPPPPPEISDEGLTLEFVSMLAQAQRAIAVSGIERAIGVIGSVAEAKPMVLDNLDEDALWQEVTDMLGVSPRISRNPDERSKLRRARAESEKAAASLAASQQQAATAKDLAAAPTTPGNALSDLLSQFSGYNSPPAQAYG